MSSGWSPNADVSSSDTSKPRCGDRRGTRSDELMRDASETLLKVDAVMVTAAARRNGIGTALMEAAEAWGTMRGATQVIVISSAHSPMAVPFYEDRMGYARTTIAFSKRLS